MTRKVVVRSLAGLCSFSWFGWPAAASADLFLVFEEGQAAVSQRVEVISGDRQGPAVWPPVLGVHLYFVPMSHAKSPRHHRVLGRRMILPGYRWGRCATPTGESFTLHRRPECPPGSYTIGFWCIPCAPPKGATFTGAYPGHAATGKPLTTILRVIPAAAGCTRSPSERTPVWEFILGIATLAAVHPRPGRRCPE